MFKPRKTPRVFALPCGVDFPEQLVAGLRARMQGRPPEDMARITVIVNTARMQRRMVQLFESDHATFLPKIRLLSSLAQDPILYDLPPARTSLARRLDLIGLVQALIAQEPDLAPKSAVLDLASSLAALLAEMQGEGVGFDAIEALDLSAQSDHWARAQKFLTILRPLVEPADDTELDAEGRARRAAQLLADHWQTNPPEDPIIIAGSTGSRGATALIMDAVARLPQGALVLPGFDMDMPKSGWDDLHDALLAEDHPQFRFARLMQRLDLSPADIAPWTDAPPAAPLRTALVSLALRPAPVTDCWMREGPMLGDLRPAANGLNLIEAPTARAEAQTIAFVIRGAIEAGKTIALITPDRGITRQVSAALARWGIRTDDSAGVPLGASPVGRFLRQIAQLYEGQTEAPLLIALLKHPLCHKGADRGAHLRLTRELELHLRDKARAYLAPEDIQNWAAAQKDEMATQWADWLCQWAFADRPEFPAKLSAVLRDHLALAHIIANGQGENAAQHFTQDACPIGPETATLWQGDDGGEARQTLMDYWQAAQRELALDYIEYASAFTTILGAQSVRSTTAPHPNALIWGTMEARVQGAETVILAGLNEGSWPEMPPIDPWLNRALRVQAGLLLPERRVGLSAHDFQQAIAAPEVWLTRSIKSDEAQTVPSRWLNRLTNLLNGLPDQGGKEALDTMRAGGARALAQAALLEQPIAADPAPRPAPQPPKSARPDRLSVTQVKTLVRDPYAIYAQKILRLIPLAPLGQTADPLIRGTILHEIFERFIRDTMDDPDLLSAAHLRHVASTVLNAAAPWAAARAMWQARVDKIAPQFIADEQIRRATAAPAALEARGRARALDGTFTLTGVADRIDLDADGNAHLFDYKTGTPPSQKEQKYFDKQLYLMAAMIEQGAFGDLAPRQTVHAQYLSLNGSKNIAADLEQSPSQTVWQEFEALLLQYQNPDQPYTARAKMQKNSDKGDYDHLARYGEWDTDQPGQRIKVGS